jgi:hypothetical protein
MRGVVPDDERSLLIGIEKTEEMEFCGYWSDMAIFLVTNFLLETGSILYGCIRVLSLSAGGHMRPYSSLLKGNEPAKPMR